MIENYASMKKEDCFLLVFIDAGVKTIEEFKAAVEGEESGFACMIEKIDFDELKKVYKIGDEESNMRNGLKNAIYNSIALKGLR